MRTNNEKGGALLAVLWLSAALAAIAFSLAATVRSETDRASTAADGLRAWYLASGSVERGIQWMMWGEEYRNPDGSARFWEPNKPRLYLNYPSGAAIVEMIPESSKLNINTSPAGEIEGVALAISGDPSRAALITQGILARRTGGPPPGPENLFAPPTFSGPRASFEEIEELLSVPGVTPELYYGNFLVDSQGRSYPRGGLRDSLSVWGSNGPFDVNTVSPALLESLGVTPEAIGQLLSRRAVQPFKTTSDVVQAGLPSRFGLGGGYVWTLRATARLTRADGTPSEVVRTASAVVRLLDRKNYFATPVHVLRYYEDAWSQLAIAPPSVMIPGVVQ